MLLTKVCFVLFTNLVEVEQHFVFFFDSELFNNTTNQHFHNLFLRLKNNNKKNTHRT